MRATRDTSAEELSLLQEWASSQGVTLSRDDQQQLDRFRRLLIDWNSRTNLTRIVDPHEILIKHFCDSIAVVPHVPRDAALLDIGTGAGFPGIVICLLRPDVRLWMAEANARKVGFLEHVRRTLALDRCEIVHRHLATGEVELAGMFDVVVSRAVGRPVELLPLARPLLRDRGRAICMLGRRIDAAADLAAVGRRAGYELATVKSLELPEGAGDRHLAVFRTLPASCST